MNRGYRGDPDRRAVTFSANPDTRYGARAIARHSNGVDGHEIIGTAYEPPTKQTPAGTKKIRDAESKISGMLKDGAKVKLDGIDPEVADSIATSIQSVIERYPSVKNAFAGFTTDEPPGKSFTNKSGVLACFNGMTETIYLNKQYYGDKRRLEKAYQDGVDKKFHPVGTTADSIVTHEMGHAIDSYISGKVIPRDKYFWGHERISTRMWNNDIKNARKKGEPLTGKSIKDGLSGYAGSSAAEYFAEGFAEYITSPNPRPMANSIGKRLETYIKKAEKVGG